MGELNKKDRVWLITGCSTGIGREIANLVLASGQRAAVTARNPDAVADLVAAYPDQALALALDVTENMAVIAAVNKTQQHFGTIDVLVNNAGYGYMSALEEGEDAPIIMKYVNIVRAFLVAGKGRKVIDADYESLEPHCFASVSGDKKLQEIFDNGSDFYSYVAIQTENLEGVSADKKADNYLKKLDPVKRNKAKAYSLGVAYGMEAYALKMTLGVDQKTAEGLIKGYLDGFPQLRDWRENSRKKVKENGFIKNYVGRVRHLPRVKKIYDKFGERMMDWRFR